MNKRSFSMSSSGRIVKVERLSRHNWKAGSKGEKRYAKAEEGM